MIFYDKEQDKVVELRSLDFYGHPELDFGFVYYEDDWGTSSLRTKVEHLIFIGYL